MKESREFYVIQFGVRSIKYLGSTYHRYVKVGSVHDAERFESAEMAERYLNIFEKGRIKKVVSTYELLEE